MCISYVHKSKWWAPSKMVLILFKYSTIHWMNKFNAAFGIYMYSGLGTLLWEENDRYTWKVENCTHKDHMGDY